MGPGVGLGFCEVPTSMDDTVEVPTSNDVAEAEENELLPVDRGEPEVIGAVKVGPLENVKVKVTFARGGPMISVGQAG
jgi:hypothetical protein